MNNESEMVFWKNGDYDAEGGYFVKSELKTFINKLIEAGHDPVGIKIDLESFLVEVFVAMD
jgi:hypothetical protein